MARDRSDGGGMALPGSDSTDKLARIHSQSTQALDARMLALSLALLTALGPAPRAADSIRTGEDLVRAMHAKYADSWYHSLSFVQRVVRPGAPEGEWWEAMKIPGRLRIDVSPVDSGTTFVYRADSVFRFAQGKLTAAGPGTNVLLVLGFDVYGQPPERTIEVLKAQHFDLSRLRTETWQGRPAWVVGGDGNEFWIDRERLLFVRVVETPSGGPVSDIRFDKYQRLGGGWIAPEVVFIRDGKEVMREIYRDMRADPPGVDDALFAVPPWHRAAWVPKGS